MNEEQTTNKKSKKTMYIVIAVVVVVGIAAALYVSQSRNLQAGLFGHSYNTVECAGGGSWCWEDDGDDDGPVGVFDGGWVVGLTENN